jgi:hypothetical protein
MIHADIQLLLPTGGQVTHRRLRLRDAGLGALLWRELPRHDSPLGALIKDIIRSGWFRIIHGGKMPC